MTAHAFLPPSGAASWLHCPKWALVNAVSPSPTTDAAEEGTAMHELGELILKDALRGINTPAAKYVGHTFNGIEIDEEMAEAVQVYVDYCLELCRKFSIFGGNLLMVEGRVDIPSIHAQCWGTLDFGLYAPEKRVIHVVDFKGGMCYVDEYENWQLICYLIGLLDKYKINGELDQVTDVVATVVQPRAYGHGEAVRSWTLKASDLRGYANKLRQAAELIWSGQGHAQAGEHCHHCPAKLECNAFLRSAFNAVDVAGTLQTMGLKDSELGPALDLVATARKRIEQMHDALEEQAKHVLRKGGVVADYGLSPAYGRQKWNKPVEEIIRLGQLLGKDLAKPGVITPKQAEKLGVDPSVISVYSSRTQQGTKLTKLTQKQLERLFK